MSKRDSLEKIEQQMAAQREHVEGRIEEHREHVEERLEEHREHVEERLEERKEHIEERFEEHKERLEEHIEAQIEHVEEKLEELGWELGEKNSSRRSIREAFREIFSIKHDTADYHIIHDRIVESSNIKGSNMCILMLAIIIASVGLNMNSTAVIIGAMLISPLMGSILSMAYGSAALDSKIFVKSLIGFVIQVVISLAVSTLYFLITPLNTVTSELLARTNPTFWDVLIAVCGGFAGIIGITRKEKSNVIPGVAIATALMPPLCTCGYSIANGYWRMLLGAGYLFLVNTYFIFLSSAIVLAILEVPKVGNVPEKVWRKIKWRVLRNTIIIIVPSIIMAALMVIEG